VGCGSSRLTELQRLPAPKFETSRRAVREVPDDEEPADRVSVYLAPEAPLSGGGVLFESDRGQVLDAIVDFGGAPGGSRDQGCGG
jgi:hypothetical protein